MSASSRVNKIQSRSEQKIREGWTSRTSNRNTQTLSSWSQRDRQVERLLQWMLRTVVYSESYYSCRVCIQECLRHTEGQIRDCVEGRGQRCYPKRGYPQGRGQGK